MFDFYCIKNVFFPGELIRVQYLFNQTGDVLEEEESLVDLPEEAVLDEGFEESEPFLKEDLMYCDPKDHSFPPVQPDRSVTQSLLLHLNQLRYQHPLLPMLPHLLL